MDGMQKNIKVKELLNTMDYGAVKVETHQIENWLKAQAKTSKGKSIEVYKLNNDKDLLTSVPTVNVNEFLKASASWNNNDVFKRSKLLSQLSQEISEKSNLIKEADAISRNILFSDSDSSMKQVTEIFDFYSNWATQLPSAEPSSKNALIFVSNDCSLTVLSLALAPLLAAGHVVLLQVEDRISVVLSLLADICKNIGIPVGLIPKTELLWDSNDIQVYVQLGKLVHKSDYIPAGKKSLNIINGKIPFVVFNDADLDSAAESLVKATWQHQGMLPWSTDKVLIQEDVFESFVKKTKDVISRKIMGEATDKTVDFTYPYNKQSAKILESYIKQAEQRGIEVFRCNFSKENVFTPTLFIGGNCMDHNSFSEMEHIACITATAFRTSAEVINLANNSTQGFGASIWTGNTNLGIVIAQKLNVGIVWINDHGYFIPNYGFSVQKQTGHGYLGGEEGLLQFISKCNDNTSVEHKQSGDKLETSPSVAFANAKKGFESWSKNTFAKKIQHLKKIAEKLGNSITDIAWKSAIFSAITRPKSNITVNKASEKLVEIRQDALGVIMLSCQDVNDKTIIEEIFNTLLEGNSLIILANNISGEAARMLTAVNDVIPNCCIVIKNDGSLKEISHKDVQGYVNCGMKNTDIKKSICLTDSVTYKRKIILIN